METYGYSCSTGEVILTFCCNPELHENGCTWPDCQSSELVLAKLEDCKEEEVPPGAEPAGTEIEEETEPGIERGAGKEENWNPSGCTPYRCGKCKDLIVANGGFYCKPRCSEGQKCCGHKTCAPSNATCCGEGYCTGEQECCGKKCYPKDECPNGRNEITCECEETETTDTGSTDTGSTDPDLWCDGVVCDGDKECNPESGECECPEERPNECGEECCDGPCDSSGMECCPSGFAICGEHCCDGLCNDAGDGCCEDEGCGGECCDSKTCCGDNCCENGCNEAEDDCADLCEGVECGDCEECNPENGECEPDPDPCCGDTDPCCGVECGECEVCEGGSCVPDSSNPCCGVECGECEVCEAGSCVPDSSDPCCGVECGECEVCEGGSCVPDSSDPCCGVECGECEVCEGGSCVPDSSDPCCGVECGECEVCEGGSCVPDSSDPCCGVECGECEVCEAGSCVPDSSDPCCGVECTGGKVCDPATGGCSCPNDKPILCGDTCYNPYAEKDGDCCHGRVMTIGEDGFCCGDGSISPSFCGCADHQCSYSCWYDLCDACPGGPCYGNGEIPCVCECYEYQGYDPEYIRNVLMPAGLCM